VGAGIILLAKDDILGITLSKPGFILKNGMFAVGDLNRVT
jgi:hypothetical protein